MGFLESVFSFVFGDGDPNDNLDDLRYEQVANVIKANGGVVTAEQLLPWLDVTDAGDADSVVVEESYVVPVLQRCAWVRVRANLGLGLRLRLGLGLG